MSARTTVVATYQVRYFCLFRSKPLVVSRLGSLRTYQQGVRQQTSLRMQHLKLGVAFIPAEVVRHW
jgi:hypothetical protein